MEESAPEIRPEFVHQVGAGLAQQVEGHAAADGADSLALSRDNGYYYRILTQQGDSARGGAKDYVANGKLSGGFAVVAYPAKYGDSGIMTFLACKDGVIYQKNLGEKTAEAAAITDYNPGEGWTVVLAPEPANAPAGPRTARK